MEGHSVCRCHTFSSPLASCIANVCFPPSRRSSPDFLLRLGFFLNHAFSVFIRGLWMSLGSFYFNVAMSMFPTLGLSPEDEADYNNTDQECKHEGQNEN